MDPATTENALPSGVAGERGDSINAPAFAFEETFLCPRCNRPLALYLQPVHLSVPIDCPRCGRSLTGMIRRAIREHTAQ